MEKEIIIKYSPHKTQKPFHKSKARFRILITGRRWGKTVAGANEVIKYSVKHGKKIVWIVAPTYPQTDKCWRTIMQYLPKELIIKINNSDKVITLINGTQLWFKSAEKYDNLRGEGVDFMWLDEAAMIRKDAWNFSLSPMLMDTLGSLIITTTPKGMNWVQALWSKSENDEDYNSWQYSSKDNPYIPSTEIDRMIKSLPQKVVEQEILGLFIEDVGSVFRGVSNCIRGELLNKPLEDHIYYMGVDLAKSVDFTVIVVMNKAKQVVYYERFNQLDWNIQKRIIIRVAKKWNNAKILLDSTGLGDPIFDDLRREGLTIEGYKYNHKSKMELIDNLSIHINEATVSFPDIPVLVNELRIFGYIQKSRTSNSKPVLKYDAPSGFHDDCVNALALAVWCIGNRNSSGSVQMVGW